MAELTQFLTSMCAQVRVTQVIVRVVECLGSRRKVEKSNVRGGDHLVVKGWRLRWQLVDE